MVVLVRLAPVAGTSLLATFTVTAVLNSVVALSLVATGAPGGATVTVKVATFETLPKQSAMVYVTFAVPPHPAVGVKRTWPNVGDSGVVSRVKVPWPVRAARL